jgi:hypothetical protein
VAVQTFSDLRSYCRTSQAEITKVKDNIVLTDCSVPVVGHHLVHLCNCPEWAAAELTYSVIIEVMVTGKPDVTSILEFKHVNHINLLLYVVLLILL